MDQNMEQKLLNKYPEFFKRRELGPYKSCMHWGICVGNGWYNIIDGLCEKLSKFKGLYAEQIKEKFGTLRFYVEFSKDFEGNQEEVWDIIGKAENKSAVTCEISGEAGTSRTVRGWVKTLSEKEYEKMVGDEKE